jgi:hypothetical protein
VCGVQDFNSWCRCSGEKRANTHTPDRAFLPRPLMPEMEHSAHSSQGPDTQRFVIFSCASAVVHHSTLQTTEFSPGSDEIKKTSQDDCSRKAHCRPIPCDGRRDIGHRAGGYANDGELRCHPVRATTLDVYTACILCGSANLHAAARSAPCSTQAR